MIPTKDYHTMHVLYTYMYMYYDIYYTIHVLLMYYDIYYTIHVLYMYYDNAILHMYYTCTMISTIRIIHVLR